MWRRDLLGSVVGGCVRHARTVILFALALAAFAALYAPRHLALDTETDHLFAAGLPWRQRAEALRAAFPQFQNLLVAVIDAPVPEEADATAAALAKVLAADQQHFQSVRRPDDLRFFQTQGLLFLDPGKLQAVLDRIIDAQPFLGELAREPDAAGLLSTLSLLARGVEQNADLTPYRAALAGFHDTIRSVLDGHPRPLSWGRMLAGDIADEAGPYKFVLAQPRLDQTQLQPGGEAARVMREAASTLEFVQSGAARVRITGSVALANEEFGTVAQGAVEGMIASTLLITLWLFLAVRTWRLIVPILLTLGLGLALTLLFAAIAVGTLNLVSIGFGILFVGIAVDFAIQFCVRYREMRRLASDDATALAETGRRAGGQILVAASATAAGFLAFVPTDFRGVAELGMIAGIGMLISFGCTVTFLPAVISCCRPARSGDQVGFAWATILDRRIKQHGRPLLAIAAVLGVLGLALLPSLVFDANPLHTKDPTTEAMQTLEDLQRSPVANPFTAEILAPDASTAAVLADRLPHLPLVANVLSINSFVPKDQAPKLALIDDAREVMGVTLALQPPSETNRQPEQIRIAARRALQEIEPVISRLSTEPAAGELANDLRRLVASSDAALQQVDAALTRFLPTQLDRLRDAFAAEPVSLESIPPELRHDWLLPDGRARLQVVPKPEVRNARGLAEFVAEVASVAPDAGGAAATIVASSQTIVAAFRSAAIVALIVITLILFVALRGLLDVALVLATLLLSALMTVSLMALLPLPLNYANIIVLPLLLGVGVSFNIYFVMNWRAGQTAVLASATARAVLFSALTTGTAFGSLALSRHPGTASMGWLLLISLGFTLVGSLLFLPAALASIPPPRERQTAC